MKKCFDNLSKLLKTKREAHPTRITQRELANQLGIKTAQYIANAETARSGLSFKYMPKLCEILSIDKSDLKAAIFADLEEDIKKFFPH